MLRPAVLTRRQTVQFVPMLVAWVAVFVRGPAARCAPSAPERPNHLHNTTISALVTVASPAQVACHCDRFRRSPGTHLGGLGTGDRRPPSLSLRRPTNNFPRLLVSFLQQHAFGVVHQALRRFGCLARQFLAAPSECRSARHAASVPWTTAIPPPPPGCRNSRPGSCASTGDHHGRSGSPARARRPASCPLLSVESTTIHKCLGGAVIRMDVFSRCSRTLRPGRTPAPGIST